MTALLTKGRGRLTGDLCIRSGVPEYPIQLLAYALVLADVLGEDVLGVEVPNFLI